MLASEMIRALNQLIADHGDRQMMYWNEEGLVNVRDVVVGLDENDKVTEFVVADCETMDSVIG